MMNSWMKLTAAGLLFAAGCAEQPARSAPGFSRDETGAIIESREAESPESFAAAESGESPFTDLAEPEVGEPASSEPASSYTSADEYSFGNVEEMVPDPPQLVLPGRTATPPAPRKKIGVTGDAILPGDASVRGPNIRSGGGPQISTKVRRSGVAKERHGYSPERVYFATNREPERTAAAAQDPDLYFGGDRGPLVYGTCEVSIPYKRNPGSLPEPSILRLEFSQDPAKHVVLMEIELLPNADFWKQLRAAVDASPEKQLMLFVHGYCATFRDAARRTAQVAYDMNYQGPSMFFSWPAGAESESFEEKANYLKDLRRAEESDEDLITVLAGISRYSGAQNIHLVAHSMGNFVLTEALKTIDDRRPAGTAQVPLFAQVALAAPDINAREFVERTGERILPFSRRFTVYASKQDKALRLSKAVNGFEPLGFLNEYTQIGAKKRLFDLVDVSQLTTGWFDTGHIYYGDMPEMISDFKYLFRGVQARSLQRGLAETPPIYRLARRGE
ncbi:MAG: alpha/beta hydrolase [Planctomycetaceae bacterium]|nr:alpha/beta hydrolase [Planctomycetaceae bacterium]